MFTAAQFTIAKFGNNSSAKEQMIRQRNYGIYTPMEYYLAIRKVGIMQFVAM